MGGLGPGYEQCIQLLTMEIVRDHLHSLPAAPVDPENPTAAERQEWDAFGEIAVSRLNEKIGGFSGAQVGAAKNLAANFLRRGYSEALDSMRALDAERLIQISSKWPRA